MSETALTRQEILEAAEDVLRRFGPTKTTVVDVARALGVSHGSVYRHFPSKAALRDAVAERWLARIAEPLAGIAAESGPAPDRLHRWLEGLIAAKQSRARQDPELFATYVALAGDARDVIRAHVDSLVGQLAQIIADGIAHGEFAPADPTITARAVFHATSRFHDPAYAARWSEPGTQAAFEAVWSLLLAGLTAPPPQGA